MAASIGFLSFAPQTLSIHQSSAATTGCSASSLLAPFHLKPLPKQALSLKIFGNQSNPSSRFVRHVAISSEVGEDEGVDYSDEPRFSPDLKLFVGNLPFNVDSSALAGLFEQAGNVEMVEVIYDKISGRSRGFGFVTMSTTQEVEAAAQKFNGYEFQGRVLRVNSGPAPPKRENSSYEGGARGGSSFDSSNRVYVSNLAWGVDNLTLETFFSEKGDVRDATVVFDRETGRSRGFGFVTYSSSDEVDNAIVSFDGMDLNGRSIRVSRAESRPKREY